MIILGIDPGIATTGVGVIKKEGSKFKYIHYGVIKTTPNMDLPSRLGSLYTQLNTIIIEHKPDAVSVEELFFNTNTKTALIVAQARGVILLCAQLHKLKVTGYTPPQIKLAVCGYGKAAKNQVQHMVKRLLNLEVIPKPDDAADALAIAICHGHSYRLNSLS